MKPVILGISGPALLGGERAMLRKHGPRGVILFARNIRNAVQLDELTGELREALPEGAVLMVDQEGGRVARLKPPDWPEMPAPGSLASTAQAHAHGRVLGVIVKDAGFDVAAAPVLDLRLEGASNVIGDRAFSADPGIVAERGLAMALAMQSAGVTPVMKHIPGHGRALVDSHVALPRVTETDLSADFYPFRHCRDLPWAMTAHVLYTAIDPELPATLSRKVIERAIRGEIGFKGTLISDDLAMGALTGTPAERAAAALHAGCDIALYCPGDMAGNTAVLEAVPHAH